MASKSPPRCAASRGHRNATLARCLLNSGATRLLEVMRAQHSITSVNYHWTAARDAETLDRQLGWLAEHFQCFGESDLLDYFAGRLVAERPAIVISFDDGYRNNLHVAAPLLAKHGLTGWFFVIVNASLRDSGKKDPAISNVGSIDDVMTLQELKQIRQLGHVIGCHTASHANLGTCKVSELQREVVDARVRLEAALGSVVTSFAFPYGTPDSFTPDAVALVHSHYRFVFNSFPEWTGSRYSPVIGRYYMDPSWSVDQLRMRISGPLSLKYLWSRRTYMKALSACGRTSSRPSGT